MSDYQGFAKHISNFGNYAWWVLFVEAPFDEVAAEYSRAVGQPRTENVEVSPVPSNRHAPFAAVVKIRGSNWCVIFHRLGACHELSCVELGAALNARAIQFLAEDTSGCGEFRIYDKQTPATRYVDRNTAELEEEYAEYGADFELCDEDHIVESYEELMDRFKLPLVRVHATGPQQATVHRDDAELVERVDLVPWGD